MKSNFYIVISAQFFSSLADSALLLVAISALESLRAPLWFTPILKLLFVLPYIVLAAFVGAFADSMPKGRVMFIANAIKITGCSMMFFGVHPLISYGIAGLGAAAYSPAKYGIVTELLPPERLVAANGWIEGSTVLSIILGTGLGGILVSGAHIYKSAHLTVLAAMDPWSAALLILGILYLIAAAFNLGIKNTGAKYSRQLHNPVALISEFSDCFAALWKDRLAQISLAMTTLFWGVGACLQFIVLKWAEYSLGVTLAGSTIFVVIVAMGVTIGAGLAAWLVPLRKAMTILPIGAIIGLCISILAFVNRDYISALDVSIFPGLHLQLLILISYALLFIIGVLSGFFLVPMNALLQHRGHVLLSAGHSIAVQNFNENISILVLLAIYSAGIWISIPVNILIFGFGFLVVAISTLILLWHSINDRQSADALLQRSASEHS
ncbi:lysophospholipid transporter LplT [Burkholderia ubonensis]|uniref:lysophospholipid transporter LplT n=1 Tax=Burkholderia ubonensis TaxID=101571 RepID=UPI0007585629|nr:lysophospholipid transporter LplT [Burkholderia ubonensis]